MRKLSDAFWEVLAESEYYAMTGGCGSWLIMASSANDFVGGEREYIRVNSSVEFTSLRDCYVFLCHLTDTVPQEFSEDFSEDLPVPVAVSPSAQADTRLLRRIICSR